MTRIKSFAAPHKGLRNVISKFILQLGYTDFANSQQLQSLKQLGEEMFFLLNDHVHTENEFTLKRLEEKVPGSSKHDLDDHHRLDEIQATLERQLRNFTGNESHDDVHAYYLNFSKFQSEYLEHIYEEEMVTELLLQKYFTDEQLSQHRVSIMQKIEFPTLLLWLKYVIPAQREEESMGMLLGLKANAPKEVFTEVLKTIKSEIEVPRYESLVAKLNR